MQESGACGQARHVFRVCAWDPYAPSVLDWAVGGRHPVATSRTVCHGEVGGVAGGRDGEQAERRDGHTQVRVSSGERGAA